MDHSNELNRFIYLFIKILFLHTFFTNSYNIKNKKKLYYATVYQIYNNLKYYWWYYNIHTDY